MQYILLQMSVNASENSPSSILADGFECSSNLAKLRVPSELNDQQGLSTSRILHPLDFELCAFSGNLISDT